MGNNIIVYTKYDESGHEFGGGLQVSKFSVRNTGTQEKPTNRMEILFEGTGFVRRARMYLDFNIAVPLARNLLSVAEGYISKTEAVIAW